MAGFRVVTRPSKKSEGWCHKVCIDIGFGKTFYIGKEFDTGENAQKLAYLLNGKDGKMEGEL